jgi:hypothetical protein
VARDYQAWITYEKVERTRRTVPAKRLFDIRQGVRLGNDVFIVEKEYLEKLGKVERRFFRPAVMNLSISEGSLKDSYYVFYPYGEGLPPTNTEEDLADHVPTYFGDRLFPAKQKLAARKSLRKANLHWWDLLRRRSWQEEMVPKIVSKYFGGPRSFAFDSTGEFVVVVGNAWLLKRGTLRIPITDREIYLAILAYLNTDIAADLLEYVSIQISGGQWDLSHKYLAGLPIPNLSKLSGADLNGLIQLGDGVLHPEGTDLNLANVMVLSFLNR